MTEVAQTKRLILRQLEVEDLDDLYRIYRSGHVAKYVEPMDDDYHVEKAKLESYIYYMYGFYGFGLFAVCLKDSGRLIGRCGVWISELNGEPELEIGYMIEADEQGKGYALESVQAVLRFACEATDVERVIARIHKENVPSAALALKAGFKNEGAISGNKDVNLYTCTLIRSDAE